MSVRFKRPPQEYTQVVWCLACNYGLRITVQSRRGSHWCHTCNNEMAVYEPRMGDRMTKPYLFAPPSGPSAMSRSDDRTSCEHDFEANVGLYDSEVPYCKKCGVAQESSA